MNKFLGFHNDNEIPFSQDQLVKIPKGTLIEHRSELKEARKDYMIKVDHILPGRSLWVGYFGKTKSSVYFMKLREDDLSIIRHVYGTDKLEDLWPMMNVIDYGSQSCSLYLPVENPQIRWAGRGGYFVGPVYVCVECDSATEANEIAGNHDIMFGIGCECCGPRWSSAWGDDELTSEPMVYGKPLTEDNITYKIIYKDGRIVEGGQFQYFYEAERAKSKEIK